MNDAQLQARLRHSKFDGAAGGRPKKLLSHVLKMGSLMEGHDNLAEFEATHNQFLKDLTVYEFNMGRIQVVVDTSHQECIAHKELQAQVKLDIERTAQDIAVLKEQVAHERVIRANKEESSLLAKQVEKLPPRSKTEKDKAILNDQLARLEEQTFVQTQKMELRKKQFQLMLHLVDELRRADDDDAAADVTPSSSIAALAACAMDQGATPASGGGGDLDADYGGGGGGAAAGAAPEAAAPDAAAPPADADVEMGETDA